MNREQMEQAYRDWYHKIAAPIGIDEWCRIVEFVLKRAAPQAVTKEWCMKMAELEPEEGVPSAGFAALDNSTTVIPVSPDELKKLEAPQAVTLSDEQIAHIGHRYSEEHDEPLYTFDRAAFIAAVREATARKGDSQ